MWYSYGLHLSVKSSVLTYLFCADVLLQVSFAAFHAMSIDDKLPRLCRFYQAGGGYEWSSLAGKKTPAPVVSTTLGQLTGETLFQAPWSVFSEPDRIQTESRAEDFIIRVVRHDASYSC
jgi:hypothetical protein